MTTSRQTSIVPATLISSIYVIRSARSLLDADLAILYRVSTAHLNRAVLRNRDRFPQDFMFRLSVREASGLICQSGISRVSVRGGRRFLPYAFTEQGVAMLSSVLRSKSAVQVNIAIMRAFVQLRRAVATNEELRKKIERMEQRYDAKFDVVFSTIKQMLEPPARSRSGIGFHAPAKRMQAPSGHANRI
jgi:ORF6N domain